FSRDWSSDVCSSDLHVIANTPELVSRTYPASVMYAAASSTPAAAMAAATRASSDSEAVECHRYRPPAAAVTSVGDPSIVSVSVRSEERRVGTEWRRG